MGLDRGKVLSHIDQNIPSHIQKLQELVRQPSISPENKGVRDCANLVLGYFKELGCKASLIETSGNPVVYGRYDAGADKTIVIYMMYDTMPVDEPGWRVDPLAAALVDNPPFKRSLVALPFALIALTVLFSMPRTPLSTFHFSRVHTCIPSGLMGTGLP